MDFGKVVDLYMSYLVEGDREGCRRILGEALQTGTPANVIYTEMFWPIMTELDKLYRTHRIDGIKVNMATRINRTLVDQLQSKLPRKESRGKKIVISCANFEPEELGAQMCSDLFESEGWEVKFLGGGIAADEIVSYVSREQPDILFIYGTRPSGAPDVRKVIDGVRELGACPQMRILLSGGVFNRAEGLWEEIGADLFASTAKEALEIALSDRRREAPPVRRRRRKVEIDAVEEEVTLYK